MIREWCAKLRLLASRRDPGDGLRDEIEAHLAFEIEENIARGLPAGEARAAARRHIGNLTRIEERARDSWSWRWLDSLAQDLRISLRGLRRAPGFAAVVTMTLALGIGANTAVFSVVNAVVLRPLPFPAAERLVQLGESDPKAEGISVTWVNYQHWRKENHSFEEMAGMHTAHLTLTGHGEAVLTRAATVTSAFFQLTGAHPLLGRVFDAHDDRPGAGLTAVLACSFWVDKLGADKNILGRTLTLNGQPYTVTGVLPPQYKFYDQNIDLYLPLYRMQGEIVDRGAHGSMRLLARLKPGVTLASAIADLNSIMRHLAESDPGPESQHHAYGVFLAEDRIQEVRPTLLFLLVAAGLVLCVACANVASLLLARGITRSKELAIRAAIGAGRARIVKQLLVDSLILALFGGLAGCLLAQWGLRALIAIGPREIPRLAETSFDGRVLLFAAAVTLLTALITGLAPVFAAGKADLASVLKDNPRGSSGSRGAAMRSGLVVAEIAFTMVLAFAATLLIRNLAAARSANPGYDPEHVLALELILPSSSYRSAATCQNFYHRLKQDLRALPGVTAVGAVNCPPAAGDCGDWFYSILDRAAPEPAEVPVTLFNSADPDYFRALRIPMRQGRAFTEQDSHQVAIVNEAFAHKWWPGRTAVGGRIKWGGPYRDGPVYEIVGVAGNTGQMGLGTEPYPEVYMPLSQWQSEAVVVMVRAAGDPRGLELAVRRRVAAIDRNLPIQSLRPFAETVAGSLAQRQFRTLLLGSFAGLAMLLASVGIYGLLSHWVRSRESEIAIRLALGAGQGTIMRWTGWQALRLSATGAAIGIIATWAVSRWLASAVPDLDGNHLAVLAAAALGVIALAIMASAAPAWRASHVDPVNKLRRG